jgi:hypothetical protein
VVELSDERRSFLVIGIHVTGVSSLARSSYGWDRSVGQLVAGARREPAPRRQRS